MFRKFGFASFAFVAVHLFIGCAGLKENWVNNPTPEQIREKMENRVVYTPLLPSRTSTDINKMEVLLRPPEEKYREIGFISMYRESSDESAADLIPFVKERAAKEGANAILLMELGEKPIGVSSSGAFVPIAGVTFDNSYTTFVKEGTIRGVAIVYGK